MTPLETAINLNKLGYWSHLIHPGDKRPVGNSWGLNRWDIEKLKNTAERYPDAGVGIALGPGRAPGGGDLIALDKDGPGAGESINLLLGGEIPGTPEWTSARGGQLLFVVDLDRFQKALIAAGGEEGRDAKGKGAWHLAELPGLEIRAGGYKSDGTVKQVQSVVPPTIGTDGKPRKWVVNPKAKPEMMPESAFEFLGSVAERKAMREEAPHVGGNGATTTKMKAKVAASKDAVESYVAAAFKKELDAVESSAEGTRNDRLNEAAFSLGTLVGAKVLIRSEVEKALTESARRAKLGGEETRKTIQSGLDAGELKPRDLSNVGTRTKKPSTNGVYPPPVSPNGVGHHIDDSELARFPHTDTGNAERMAARHGHNMRHCHPWKKGLHFDGRRWAVDDIAAIRRMAKDTARKILVEASTVEDKDHRDALIKHARATESKSRLSSMIDLVSAEEGIPILPGDLNTRPWLLNVLNGTIDLNTGELRPHNRKDFITALAPVVFNPDAKCPQYDATLDRFLAGKTGLIAFWDRLCGIALTGDVSEQILPILHGVGDNGKSTLVGALLGILGTDYAAIAPPNLVLTRQGECHPTDRAFLFGKRLAVVMETPEEARLNESLIKQLTGSDPITARRMNEDFWTFDPTHKLWMCTNHKPVIRGTDHAIWRRPKLVPFDVKIEEKDKIINFPALLKAEYPGILARCVRGCLDWRRNGLGVPKEVSEATDGYRKEQDSLRVFIEEECTQGPGLRAKAGMMYQRYRAKLEHLGEQPISLTKFGLAMTERGFAKETSNGIWYLGIGLNS